VRRHFWDLQSASRRRTSLTGFIIGLVLGCLVGGIMAVLPQSNNAPSATLDVNEATGKTQIHLQGKPNIK
jgi:ABC-type nitrate/sulfonate/bicarbonate transport system permease component